MPDSPMQLDVAEYVITRLLNVLPAGVHKIHVEAAGLATTDEPLATIEIKHRLEERQPEDVVSDFDQMLDVHKHLTFALNRIGVLTVVSPGALGEAARVWGLEQGRISALTAAQAAHVVANKYTGRDAPEI